MILTVHSTAYIMFTFMPSNIVKLAFLLKRKLYYTGN